VFQLGDRHFFQTEPAVVRQINPAQLLYAIKQKDMASPICVNNRLKTFLSLVHSEV
jgi:hypothetical protein